MTENIYQLRTMETRGEFLRKPMTRIAYHDPLMLPV